MYKEINTNEFKTLKTLKAVKRVMFTGQGCKIALEFENFRAEI